MRPLGSINVDELIIPIIDIELKHGQIMFVGYLAGPTKASRGTRDYSIHGSDGRVIYRAQGIAGLKWQACDAYSTLTLYCPLRVHGPEAREMSNLTGPPPPLATGWYVAD